MTHPVHTQPPRARTDAPPGAWLDRALALAPFALLGLSFAITVAVDARPMGSAWFAWLVALTAVTAGLRVWWQHRARSHPTLVGCFVANLLLTLGLLTLSPLYGVYAFVGYLDAVAIFSGAVQVPALIAAASLNALAQSGGPQGALSLPVIFAFLLVANSALAVFMVQVDRHRQRTVTRLEQALADLKEAERVNAVLHHQLIEQAKGSGMLQERQRVSREIHDTVAQGLIALLRQIEAAAEASTAQDARAHLCDADATARESLAEARRAVAALASPRLDDADLPSALHTLIASWSTSTGIAANFTTTGQAVEHPHDADLLRVCQEGLSNVARHSGASRVEVTLAYLPDLIRLTVQDDGIGLQRAPGPSVSRPGDGPAGANDGTGATGSGLVGMQHRMATAGGTLKIRTPEGGGCDLTAAIPR